MVFWAHDLDYYREHLRGLSLDPAELPGPVVATAEDMLEAVVAATRGQAGTYDDAYRAFTTRWCPDRDGAATARALDALLES
jgi:CDP-glycerol glycerophosphotransferase